MPILKTPKMELNEPQIRDILIGCAHVFIEKCQSMPGQGISSIARYMTGYGIIRGICVGLGIPYTLVHPKTWKGVMMKDMPKEKDASILRALQLYPKIDLPRKKDHGKADALLLSLWGKLFLEGRLKSTTNRL